MSHSLLGKSLGTALAGAGLLVGAATGVQALTSDAPSPSSSASPGSSSTPSCGPRIKKPEALREAAKKARSLPAGPKRTAAKAAIRKDLLAGKYGKALQERAEQATRQRFAALPAELRAALEKVRAMPKGEARAAAAKQVRKDVLAGKYGAEVKAEAEERHDARVEDRKARAAASTPALKEARRKIAAMPKGEARTEAAKALHEDVLAGKYGEAAESYLKDRAEDRTEAREEMRAKAEARREACSTKDEGPKKNADERSDRD